MVKGCQSHECQGIWPNSLFLTSCLSPGAAKHTHTSHKSTYLQCFTIIYRIYTIIYIRNSCCLISSHQATLPHFGSFQHLQPEVHFLHDQINLFLPPLRYMIYSAQNLLLQLSFKDLSSKITTSHHKSQLDLHPWHLHVSRVQARSSRWHSRTWQLKQPNESEFRKTTRAVWKNSN